MTKRRPLTATSLRAMLSISLFLIAALTGSSFYFASTQLREVAVDVSHSVVDSNTSNNNIGALQTIKKYLDDKKDVVARTNSIVAESQSYQYQDQIITDLNDYASRSSISITNIDFSSGTTQTNGSANPPANAPITPTNTPSGVKSISVNVTIHNPVDYINMLRFIKAIEDNLTKMQISKIGLSKNTNDNGVTSDILTIEVYVR